MDKKIDLQLIKKLYDGGLITTAGVKRCEVVNDYLELNDGQRLQKEIFITLAQRHFLSRTTVRDIILKFKRGK